MFALFNEIGIIAQLSRATLEARLPDGLIGPHFNVVNHLTCVGDGRTPLSMARAFQLPKTTMTHTVAGLERHGLVEVRPNPRDGRSENVWLTDAGRAFRERALREMAPDARALLAGIPAVEVAALIEPLAAIRRRLDRMRDPDSDDL